MAQRVGAPCVCKARRCREQKLRGPLHFRFAPLSCSWLCLGSAARRSGAAQSDYHWGRSAVFRQPGDARERGGNGGSSGGRDTLQPGAKVDQAGAAPGRSGQASRRGTWPHQPRVRDPGRRPIRCRSRPVCRAADSVGCRGQHRWQLQSPVPRGAPGRPLAGCSRGWKQERQAAPLGVSGGHGVDSVAHCGAPLGIWRKKWASRPRVSHRSTSAPVSHSFGRGLEWPKPSVRAHSCRRRRACARDKLQLRLIVLTQRSLPGAGRGRPIVR